MPIKVTTVPPAWRRIARGDLSTVYLLPSGVFWSRKPDATAEFLYKVLVSDAPRGHAKTVAARMGVPYPTLSKYWLGKRRFPASLVRPLFLALDGDARVAEFFVLEAAGFRLERSAETEPPGDLSRAVMTLASLEAKVTDLYLEATTAQSEAGEAISRGEAEALRAAVQQLICTRRSFACCAQRPTGA